MKSAIHILFILLCIDAFGGTQSMNTNGRQVPFTTTSQSDELLSYSYEDFEGTRFPPAGWMLEFSGTQFWTRYSGASGYGVGMASAKFDFWSATGGTTQSLVLFSMGTSVPGDSVRFDHAYASYTGQVDRLLIETSTNGGTTYLTLMDLAGGASGPLVTAPPQTTGFVPTAAQWASKSYSLPVGTNRLRFRAVSAYGNNLYIDNCIVGTQRAVDVGTQSIDIPSTVVNVPRIPKVTVENHGTSPQTFTVTLMISPDGYTSVKTVTALGSNTRSTVSFDSWTPTIGTHNATAFTRLPGDLDPSNDTLRSVVQGVQAQQVTNIAAFFRDGQVFLTWDNIAMTNVAYTLYKSSNPILHGSQLATAQNLGNVRDNSSLNKRLSNILGATRYLKIDSASPPLASNKGLFVATSTAAGSFYYAVIPFLTDVEDTTIVVGSNSLASPVNERVLTPKPVWQESIVIDVNQFDVYVLYTTKVASSVFPQMTTAGTFPCNFGLVKHGTATAHPVTFYLHPGGGYFLMPSTYLRTIGDPNEWVVSIDEWIPGAEGTTYSYGYHEDYDVLSDTNPIPTSGLLYNYTARKVEFIINWAIRNLPVDSTRTYMTGWSMGAIGTIINCIMAPQRIAALFIYAPVYNMAAWGSGAMDRLWGTYQTNLLTNEGYRRNERLNALFLVGARRSNSLPVMFTFCGKYDAAVGWTEKVAFYDSLRVSRHGGFHFWSQTDHQQVFLNCPWQPSFPDFSFFTRYRTNLSYPAFSNCSINDNPGNGTPSNGDPIGSINGHLDWNDNIVDLPNQWGITLHMKDLLTNYGADVAPDSATTDVTLRRLQAFNVPLGHRINWENRRNNIVVQQDSFVYDSGLITIPGVKVYKDSSRLTVTYDTTVSVAEQKALPREFALSQNYPNPFNPSTTISYSLPHTSFVTITVYNTLGQQVSQLVNEQQQAGFHDVMFRGDGLASGVYFYRISVSPEARRDLVPTDGRDGQAGNFVASKKMLLLK